MTYKKFIEDVISGKDEIAAVPFYYFNFKEENAIQEKQVSTIGKLIFKSPNNEGTPFYIYMFLKIGESKSLYIIRGYVAGEKYEVSKANINPENEELLTNSLLTDKKNNSDNWFCPSCNEFNDDTTVCPTCGFDNA